jgi:hypothetical protein
VRRVVAGVLLVLLGAPSAVAEPVTLYFHLDGFQDFAITTTPPPPGHDGSITTGIGTMTATCYDGAVPGQSFTQMEFSTNYGYVVNGQVVYSADAGLRVPPQRGIVGDLAFNHSRSPAVQPVLHWYLQGSTQGLSAAVPYSGVAPQVTVRATIREGDAISVDDAGYNTGALVASGEATADLMGPLTTGAEHDQVGGRDVYHFAVPLTVEGDGVVPANESINVRVDTFLRVPGCTEEGFVMANSLQPHSSSGHRPRLDAHVDGMMMGALNLITFPEGLAVIAGAATVFGNFDVSEPRFRVHTPDRGTVELVANRTVLDGYGPCGHDCGHTTVIAYDVLLPAESFVPGRYDFEMTFTNLQGTAERTLTATFEVPQRMEAPAPPLPLAIGALAAVAVLLRRLRGP